MKYSNMRNVEVHENKYVTAEVTVTKWVFFKEDVSIFKVPSLSDFWRYADTGEVIYHHAPRLDGLELAAKFREYRENARRSESELSVPPLTKVN